MTGVKNRLTPLSNDSGFCLVGNTFVWNLRPLAYTERRLAAPSKMARLTHVLVVDSDPKGLKTVSFGFEREGCRVTAADSTDAALVSLQTGRPDAVVLALRQGVDASRFILEDLTHGQNLPVVAMGEEAHRRAVVQSNAEFLPIPTYLRDVITATRLRAAMRPAANGQGGVVQAALSEFGLFFLLRTFLALKTSAVVQLDRANRKGELKFSKGELRTAQVGTITGAPALNQLLLWEEAAMEIRFKPVTARSQFNNKGSDLMEEAERFLRDFAHTARNLGSAQTVYEVVRGAEQDVQPEMVPVLRLFDGTRTIADILDESPFRVFDTLRIVGRFVDTETVQRKQGVEPRPAVSTSAASPLMEAWLKGDTEVVEPAPVATESRGGQTGPLPTVTGSAQMAGAPKVEAPRALPAAARPVAGTLGTAAPGGMNRPPAGAAQDAVAPRSTRGELVARAGASGNDKSMRPRPSMVIDLPPELLETPPETSPRSHPAGASAASGANPFDAPAANVQAPRHQPEALRHPAEAGLPAKSPVVGPAVPRTTGSLEIASAARTTKPAPRSSGSIELDPALMAELESAQSAQAPPTPPPILAAPAKHAVVHTPKPAQPMAVGGPGGRSMAPVVAAKTRTGEFDQLEKDFFAREADLYKDGGSDSFDDLE